VRDVNVTFCSSGIELEDAMTLMTSPKKRMCTRLKRSVEAADGNASSYGDGGITAVQREACSSIAAAGGVRYDVAVTGRGAPTPPRKFHSYISPIIIFLPRTIFRQELCV